MNIEKFKANGKDATLYLSEKESCPLIVLNNYSGNGASVLEKLEILNCSDRNLLAAGSAIRVRCPRRITPLAPTGIS